MDDEPSVVIYDMAAQTLRLRLSGGEELRLADFNPEPSFRAVDAAATPHLPLWLTREQADILSKMMHFILDRQKITEGARAVLNALAPRVDELRDELELLALPEDADAAC